MVYLWLPCISGHDSSRGGTGGCSEKLDMTKNWLPYPVKVIKWTLWLAHFIGWQSKAGRIANQASWLNMVTILAL